MWMHVEATGRQSSYLAHCFLSYSQGVWLSQVFAAVTEHTAMPSLYMDTRDGSFLSLPLSLPDQTDRTSQRSHCRELSDFWSKV